MTIVVTVLVVVVAVLALLVAGLLRSHAAMLRHLHDLGMGLYDEQPRTAASDAAPSGTPGTPRPNDAPAGRRAPDVVGTTPAGDATGYSLAGRDHDTLVLFLSVDCATCQDFWSALVDGRAAEVETSGRRLLVVTRGPEDELVGTLGGRTSAVPVVMSSETWRAYQVPGSPYVVHVDGPSGRVRGEGTSGSWEQLLDLVDRGATETAGTFARRGRRAPRHGAPRDSDEELLAIGLRPGDPSLHPAPAADHDQGSRP